MEWRGAALVLELAQKTALVFVALDWGSGSLWNRVPVQWKWFSVRIEERSSQRGACKQKNRAEEGNETGEKEMWLVVCLVTQPLQHRRRT